MLHKVAWGVSITLLVPSFTLYFLGEKKSNASSLSRWISFFLHHASLILFGPTPSYIIIVFSFYFFFLLRIFNSLVFRFNKLLPILQIVFGEFKGSKGAQIRHLSSQEKVILYVKFFSFLSGEWFCFLPKQCQA